MPLKLINITLNKCSLKTLKKSTSTEKMDHCGWISRWQGSCLFLPGIGGNMVKNVEKLPTFEISYKYQVSSLNISQCTVYKT